MFVGLLVVGRLAAFWATNRDTLIYPQDYVGTIPPGVDLETYARLVPWELRSITEDYETTVLHLDALSGACNLSKETAEMVTETFDRVEIRESAETVIIETWLGPPERDAGLKGTYGRVPRSGVAAFRPEFGG